MTRKQKAKLKRNEEIRNQAKIYCIEDVAATFKMSVPSIYRILKHEN